MSACQNLEVHVTGWHTATSLASVSTKGLHEPLDVPVTLIAAQLALTGIEANKMGHGNSNKLYVTHAEHSGMFGQHTASSAGFKA